MCVHNKQVRSFLSNASHIYLESLSSLPFGGVTDGNGSDCEYGSDPHTILESEVNPCSRTGRVKWSKESELELELSPGSLRTICLGGILPEDLFKIRCTSSFINCTPFVKHKKTSTYQHAYLWTCPLVGVLTSCVDPCKTAS